MSSSYKRKRSNDETHCLRGLEAYTDRSPINREALRRHHSDSILQLQRRCREIQKCSLTEDEIISSSNNNSANENDIDNSTHLEKLKEDKRTKKLVLTIEKVRNIVLHRALKRAKEDQSDAHKYSTSSHENNTSHYLTT